MYIRLHPSYVRQFGVTLVELMTAIAILAILSTLAIPSFQSLFASIRLSSATSELTASFSRARAESIRLGTRVTVCRSNAANTQCSNAVGGGWESGWLILQDVVRPTANASVDTGDVITYIGQSLPADIRVVGNLYMASYVSFTAAGQPKAMSGGITPATIRVCSTSPALQDSERARDLSMSATGKILVRKNTATIACPAP